MIHCFEDLPEYLKFFLIKLFSETGGPEYAMRKIPALNNKTIIELMNGEEGEEMVVEVLNRLSAKMGGSLGIDYDKKKLMYTVLEYDKVIFPEKK